MKGRLLVLGLLSCCAAVVADQAARPGAAPDGRVVLVSLDGMGTRLFLDDPVSEELRALKALRARGVMADGLVPHMPSTTANTHAALWTGAWGDVNGITSNEMPLAPRSSHAATARVSGYTSAGLRAEPLWVTAARQGVPTVAQQATQVYPLNERTTGGSLPDPPVLLHGYQAPVVAPARWLARADFATVPCRDEDAPSQSCFTWKAGPVNFRAALTSEPDGARALRIRLAGQSSQVTVRHVPTEDTPPRGRALARHFSDGLLVDLPGVAPVVVYFRLFDMAPDASSLVLFQSVMQEAAYYREGRTSRAAALALLAEAGGFVGNGRSEDWASAGKSGVPLWKGGDGTRERRYLETLELGIRQTIRHAQYLWDTHRPRFLLGYVSMPDEMDHAWLGHARRDRRYEPLRRWGYQLVDRAVETYVALASPSDHVVFVSDHGMTPVAREIRVNQVLRDAGLVAVDAEGRVDATRSQVLFGRNCLLVHTSDWRDGVVPPAGRSAVLAKALAALRALPEVTAVVWSDADRERLGFGGPNGFDACLDVKPGHMTSTRVDEGPVVRAMSRPTGEHGFMPTRPDMHGILIAAGPRLRAGSRWPVQRAIDVAPLVSALLGIAPPRHTRGRPPLPAR